MEHKSKSDKITVTDETTKHKSEEVIKVEVEELDDADLAKVDGGRKEFDEDNGICNNNCPRHLPAPRD